MTNQKEWPTLKEVLSIMGDEKSKDCPCSISGLNPEGIAPLIKASKALLEKYVSFINSGDAGRWDPETDQEVIDLRKALSILEGGAK